MQVYASHHELGKTAGHSAEDEGFDCQFAEGKLYGSHQFLNWWQQVSTGHLHLNGFESLSEANKKRHPNGWRSTYKDEGFDYQKGCHQFLNWWQQVSIGHLHLNGFESPSEATKNAIQMDGVFLLAEDEGFEPPQTESESGVLPLHKSSIWNSSIICKISEKSIPYFYFFIFLVNPKGSAHPAALLSNKQRSPFPLFLPAWSGYIVVLPGSGDAFCLFPVPD